MPKTLIQFTTIEKKKKERRNRFLKSLEIEKEKKRKKNLNSTLGHLVRNEKRDLFHSPRVFLYTKLF